MRLLRLTILLHSILFTGIALGYWVKPQTVEECYPTPAPPEAQGISITTLEPTP